MKYVYVACFYPDEEERGYTVVIPDLPGAVTEGDTLEDAFKMAVDCVSGWLLDETDIPNPTPIDFVELDSDMGKGFKSYIFVDLLEYKKKNMNKSVKKTLTIPQWLNELAEDNKVNFSQILQQGLKDHLGVKEYTLQK